MKVISFLAIIVCLLFSACEKENDLSNESPVLLDVHLLMNDTITMFFPPMTPIDFEVVAFDPDDSLSIELTLDMDVHLLPNLETSYAGVDEVIGEYIGNNTYRYNGNTYTTPPLHGSWLYVFWVRDKKGARSNSFGITFTN